MTMPTPERWRRIQEVLEAALDLKEDEAAAYVDTACAGDAALCAETKRLLGSMRRAGDFLERPAAELAAALSPFDPLDLAGTHAGARIGPYRVLREAGRGGMGIVYVAERDDGEFRQRVALKLGHRGLDSADAHRRFRDERQILATLHHAGIAKLFDGGVTESGLPYFTMEYIEGTPIDRFCDEHQLSVRDRVQLFCHVCDAVQYAHNNLVIHRDLKPSNILVTANGQVKLLDFGIAKLISEDAPGITHSGIVPMTPEYASPEQARGEALSTASDVYSLGVLLYRLLTGRHPYELSGRSPAEIERAITQHQPTRPSTVVLQPLPVGKDATPEQLSALRATRPPRLSRMLRGDLDNIVLQSMRKEPERRYRTAAQLMDDVCNYLLQRPVSARPDTFTYRATTFLRRHRGSSAAAAVITLSLLAGMAGTTMQARRASIHARNAEQERDRARIQAARAERVSEFLVDLFQVSDPLKAQGTVIIARQLLDSGAARVRADLAAEPEVQATMLNVMGKVYRNLGAYDQAEPLIRTGLAVRRSTLGPNHLDVAESLSTLGVLLYERGRLDSAELVLRQALDLRHAQLEHHDTLVVDALANVAGLFMEKGQYEAAEKIYRSVLDVRRRLHGAEHVEVANALNNLGGVLKARGDLTGADTLYRSALAMRRKLLGNQHADVAVAAHELADLLYERGAHREAESLAREALTTRQTALGADHWRVAETQTLLGATLSALGRSADAEPLLESSHQKLMAVQDTSPATRRATEKAVRYLIEHFERVGKPDRAAYYRGG